MDDGEELRECGVSLVRLEDMKVENRGVLEEAMEVRDLEDHLNFDLLISINDILKFLQIE